jgi:hypothetical protein
VCAPVKANARRLSTAVQYPTVDDGAGGEGDGPRQAILGKFEFFPILCRVQRAAEFFADSGVPDSDAAADTGPGMPPKVAAPRRGPVVVHLTHGGPRPSPPVRRLSVCRLWRSPSAPPRRAIAGHLLLDPPLRIIL